ncbi:MAG: NAD-dependent epimerase/dehydratase family protein [Promethearchaeota archaeon]
MTGHCGLIGTALKERLEGLGYNIVLKIDSCDGLDVDVLENIPFNKDIKIDIFIHMADFCKINKTVKYPSLGHVNALHSYQVLEFCRKHSIPKIVYFSSSRILSKERNPYTAGKIYGEELCKAYKDCYGINYLILRPSTVYGPFWDKTKRLIHIFITNALKNEDLKIYGDPEIKTLDFTYLSDFIDGVMLAINNDFWNAEYNISGCEEYNVYKLAEKIIEKTGSSSKIIVEGAEMAQPQRVRVNNSAIKELGYSPKVLLEEGLDRCIEFYKDCLNK